MAYLEIKRGDTPVKHRKVSDAQAKKGLSFRFRDETVTPFLGDTKQIGKYTFQYLVLLAALSLGSCAAYRPVPAPKHSMQRNRHQSRSSLSVLDVKKPSIDSKYIERYKKLYQLQFPDIPHRYHIGTFHSKSHTLVAQIFIPDESHGTVVLAHGYMDHTGTMHHLIRECLTRGYTVATYDLPGHGLSSGAYASIDSFSTYASIFTEFVSLCTSQCPQPYYLVSHSTGGAITLEYLSKHTSPPFSKVILVAPLVRHAYWYPVKYFFRLGQVMQFQSVGRRYPADSGDRAFLAFRRKDPLAYKRVPAQWVAALYSWEKHFQTSRLLSCPDLIIQGDKDSVIDKKYNIKCLQKKCPGTQVQWIKGGKHYLFNESEKLRQEVLDLMLNELNETSP